MMVYDDDDLMPFGQHKGKKLANVPAADLLWYYDQPWFKDKAKKWPEYKALNDYIEDNMDSLIQGK